MKKIFFIFLSICISSMAIAQSKFAKSPVQAIPAEVFKNQILPTQPVNPLANSEAALEDILGSTIYDLQTNGSVQNRMYVYPDGSMAGTWIRGTEISSQRGTGYNYYNGTNWGNPPVARIETRHAGWPSYSPWGANGEIVVSHDDMLGLIICKRNNKGTGSWTQSILAGPAGAVDISWPRMITSGPTNNYIHIIASTYAGYQGLSYALLYYRSLDGGATWDKRHVILPGMDSSFYRGFSSDEYAWGSSHGDTIYFAVSGPWVDTFIMKSTDNGNNWTKTTVLSNANKKLSPNVVNVPPFRNSDGSVAVEMDHNGVMHLAFGIGGGYMSGGTRYVYVNLNGLVYWNSTMSMVPDSLDLDVLEANGQLLGYVSEGPNPGDTIKTAPNYQVGLSSFPQLSIDAANNVYAIWSAVAWQNPSPDLLNYRHIWGRVKFSDSKGMSEMIDLNEGIPYLFNEYVYPAMAKRILDDKLAVIFQTSTQPGSHSVDNSIPVHSCNIEYREIPLSTFGNPPPADATLTIYNVTNVAAGPVTLPVYATNLNNVGAFQFTIEYDPALMTYTGTSNWYPGITDVLIGTTTPGKLAFIWSASAAGVTITDGTFFNLNFTWLGSPETSPVTWEDDPTPREFVDYNGVPFIPLYENGSVTGTSVPSHFTKVWTGNPLFPMSIAVTQATLDGPNLVTGDEIGIFDGNICVGVYKLTSQINPNDPPFIVVSQDDPATPAIDGYTAGHTIVYKLWQSLTSLEVGNVSHTFPFAPSYVFETFTQNETAVVALAGISTITQNTPLLAGWNMISFNAQPPDMNLLTMLQPLVTSGNLVKVIDEAGNIIQHFQWGWVNNIGNMAITEGYYIKVASACTLSTSGAPILLPTTIPFITGWNMMGYPAQTQQDALAAMQPLITGGKLLKVIDEAGNIIQYFPWGWVNTIGNLKPGEGYYIKVSAPCSLTISNLKEAMEEQIAVTRPAYFSLPVQGNPYQPMSFGLAINPLVFESIAPGDEIGIFDGELCVGAFRFDGRTVSSIVMTAFADDPGTTDIEGFTDEKTITCRFWDQRGNKEQEVDLNYLDGDTHFSRLGTYVGNLGDQPFEKSHGDQSLAWLGNNHPNPFSGTTEIEYKVFKPCQVTLTVLSSLGFKGQEVVNSFHQPGLYRVNVEAMLLTPGVWFYRLEATGDELRFDETHKMVVLK